jgi:hypothetical protein
MTPKEKAKKLMDKFKYISYDLDDIDNHKECTLIAVDELIIQNGELYLIGLDGTHYAKTNSFLFEVKQEIEKL